MPTVVDSLTDATAELRLARVALESLTGSVSTLLTAKTTAAQTVINNFVSRAPSISAYVDPDRGTDDDSAGRGATVDKAYRSLEYAMNKTDQSVVRGFYLLGDVQIADTKFLFASVSFFGIVKSSHPRGFDFVRRRLTFRSEGLSSPYAGTRGIAGLSLAGGSFIFSNIELVIPTPAQGIGYSVVMFSSGSPIGFTDCLISCADASANACLIAPNGNRVTVMFGNTTLGPNVPGKVFNAVAAGGNPNAGFAYETNLTSA